MAILTGDVLAISINGANSTLAAQAHLPGRSGTFLAVRSAFNRRFYGLTEEADPATADTHIDVTPSSGPGATGGKLVGDVVEFIGNTGMQWFEKMHIFPGGSAANPNYDQNFKIDFGNILADADKLYEIYNAHRRTSQTLNTIDLSQVNPGIETPEVSATDVVGPQVSMLAAASTFNKDLTTGLGVLVIHVVRALVDGLPQFNGDAVYTFGSNAVDLPLRGSRIALNLAQYEDRLSEFMEFKTPVLPATDGKEQRLSLRKEPREGMQVMYRLDKADRRRFQAVLMDWQENPFGVPLWHEQIALTTTAAVSATQWQVSGAADVDFRVGSLAILFTSAFTFEIATIVSVTDTLITVDTGNTNSYPPGTPVMPVRVARIVRIPSGSRYRTDLEDFRVTYEFLDNATGVPAASSTAWNSNTYASRILLDDCNVMGDQLSETFDRDITVIDGGTGIVTQASGWDKNKHVWLKGFSARGRSRIRDLKALLRYIRGRQKSFWVPTKADDLEITAAPIAASQIVDIGNIDYVRYVQNRGPKNVIRVSFNNGDADEIHVIESSAAHPTDSEQERLTIASPGWTLSHALNTIERVEFLELCRMDADRFTLRFEGATEVRMNAPLRVVFDDD